MCCY